MKILNGNFDKLLSDLECEIEVQKTSIHLIESRVFINES